MSEKISVSFKKSIDKCECDIRDLEEELSDLHAVEAEYEKKLFNFLQLTIHQRGPGRSPVIDFFKRKLNNCDMTRKNIKKRSTLTILQPHITKVEERNTII
ncbi:hypothetical protein BpHYR1_012148 [Brachionus plicatilis]|uniref:Uncharacterized protein n=1 Tax=Brachionus plicatilis TaxID=10195 RepID=A0A3M7R827_BRAPC|nr:hypothetical protein BpHYR1_012148 [Brachionus plicatilis]